MNAANGPVSTENRDRAVVGAAGGKSVCPAFYVVPSALKEDYGADAGTHVDGLLRKNVDLPLRNRWRSRPLATADCDSPPQGCISS